jgi:4-hydroxy-tetrahydrodipicolinate synthase
MKLEGVYTALVTPMSGNGDVDEKALRRLVDFQIEGGVSGLVPVGTTGESPTLTGEECKRVIAIVVEQARGRVPVIAGAGSNCTSEAIEYTRDAKEVGADASLQVAPYYNKPTSEGFIRHFSAIADAVDLPLVVYNIPGRTGKNIDNQTMLEIAKHRGIVAVKEASGDIGQVMDLISKKPKDFAVLSGDDNLVFPIMALGGTGVISVASNIAPERMAKFVSAALKGNWDEARKNHYELLPLFKAIFIETNPIPIKAALAMKGMMEENYRLPMCPMAAKNREALASVLKELSI